MTSMNTSVASAALLAALVSLLSGCAKNIVVAKDKPAPAHRPARASGLDYAKTVRWDEIRRQPADVEVLNMLPAPLAEGLGSNSWLRVPPALAGGRSMIFMPNGPVNGVADYKVTAAGYLLVACNWDYQGNPSGGWQKGRWHKTDFILDGWRELTLGDLGGEFVKSDNREQLILIKKVAVGETGRLRCNKYDPPYFIVVR